MRRLIISDGWGLITGVFVGTLIFSLIIWLAVPGDVNAAPSGISISPPFQDLIFDASQAQVPVPISLTNHTDTPVTLELSVIDFGALDKTGGVLFSGSDVAQLSEQYQLAKWIALSQPTITIPAKSTQPLSVSINNDTNLGPGGHYGAVIATLKSAGTANQPLALNQSLSSLMFVNKTGGEKYRLELQQADADRTWWGGISGSDIEFANTGNVHLVPRGQIKLTDPIGRVLAQGVINQESGRILPDQVRTFAADLKQSGLPLWPGNYQITTDYRYDGSDSYESQQRSFFHIGIFLPVILFLVVIFGALLWWQRRRFRSNS